MNLNVRPTGFAPHHGRAAARSRLPRSPARPSWLQSCSPAVPPEHSSAFRGVRDRLVELSEEDRARFARFVGALLEALGPLGAQVRNALRAVERGYLELHPPHRKSGALHHSGNA